MAEEKRSGKKVLLCGNSELVVFGFRRELIQQLLREGHEVTVCFPQTEFGDGYTSAREYGCRYYQVSMNARSVNPLNDFSLMRQYHKMLKELAPDIIFTYTIKPNIYISLMAGLKKIPVVVNVSGLGTAVEKPGLLQALTVWLYRLSARYDQRVYFQNEENMAFFAQRNIAEGKRALLPGSGVNLQEYAVLPYPKGEPLHFLFIARIRKDKGIDQYLEAARRIRARHPDTVFHVLGICTEPHYLELLKKMTQEGTIVYEGAQQDVRKYQAISSCTIHPTYYPEGMSNVLLESAACGRPVITTSRSGCREVVEHGVNGLICNQQDTDDLVEKIEYFLTLPWEKRRDMGLAGRKKVETGFDRRQVVQTYMEELQQSGATHELQPTP